MVAIRAFDKSAGGIAAGVILLLVAFGFIGAAAIDVLLLSKVCKPSPFHMRCLSCVPHICEIISGSFAYSQIHRIYRSTGASFAKAQQEFANGILSNETVRNAASDAAAATVRAQMNQAASRY